MSVLRSLPFPFVVSPKLIYYRSLKSVYSMIYTFRMEDATRVVEAPEHVCTSLVHYSGSMANVSVYHSQYYYIIVGELK